MSLEVSLVTLDAVGRQQHERGEVTKPHELGVTGRDGS